MEEDNTPIVIESSPVKVKNSPKPSVQSRRKKNLPLPLPLVSVSSTTHKSQDPHTPVQDNRRSTTIRGRSTPRKRPPTSDSRSTTTSTTTTPTSAASLGRTKRDLAAQMATPPAAADARPQGVRRTSSRIVQRLTAIDTAGTDIPCNAVISQHGNAMPMFLATSDASVVSDARLQGQNHQAPASHYGYSSAKCNIANAAKLVTNGNRDKEEEKDKPPTTPLAADDGDDPPQEETLASKRGVVSLPNHKPPSVARPKMRGLVKPVRGVVLQQNNKDVRAESKRVKVGIGVVRRMGRGARGE